MNHCLFIHSSIESDSSLEACTSEWMYGSVFRYEVAVLLLSASWEGTHTTEH